MSSLYVVPRRGDRLRFAVQIRRCDALSVGCRNKISSNQVRDELCTLHSLVGRSMCFPQTGIIGHAGTVDVQLVTAHSVFSHIIITSFTVPAHFIIHSQSLHTLSFTVHFDIHSQSLHTSFIHSQSLHTLSFTRSHCTLHNSLTVTAHFIYSLTIDTYFVYSLTVTTHIVYLLTVTTHFVYPVYPLIFTSGYAPKILNSPCCFQYN